jgi:hypothetical protein
MEPALGIRLVCIVPFTLLAMVGTAEILNTLFPVLFCLVRSSCGLLWLHSLSLDTQYARQYRIFVSLHIFVVQNMMLWKDFPVAARVAPVVLLLALLGRYLPRERLRLMLCKML